MPRGKYMTPEEIETILSMAKTHTIYDIGAALDRPYISVNSVLHRHGVSAIAKNKPVTWTEDKLRELYEYVEATGLVEAGRKYGLQKRTVQKKIARYQMREYVKPETEAADKRRTGGPRIGNKLTYVSTAERQSMQRIAAQNALHRLGFDSIECVAKQFKTVGVKVAQKSKKITVDRERLEQICCLADEVVTYLEALVGSSDWNEQDCGVYTSANDLIKATNTIMDEEA